MGLNLSEPITTKIEQSNQDSQLKYCSISMQGWQKQMQNSTLCKINIDTNSKNGNSLFAIFDGYRGYQISKFLQQTFLSVLINSELYIEGNYQLALEKAFLKIDQLIYSEKGQKRLQQIKAQNGVQTRIQNQKISDTVGCTAAVVLITKKKIIVANIGNVQAFLYRDKFLQLTTLHSLNNIQQRARIQSAQCTIKKNTINGNIQLSRSFGLFSFKRNSTLQQHQQIITCQPQIKSIQRSISDSFIFIGCNGVFQKYQNQKKQEKFLTQKIKNSQNFKNQKHKQCLQNMLDQIIPEDLGVNQSQAGYKNMSAILIKFNQL